MRQSCRRPAVMGSHLDSPRGSWTPMKGNFSINQIIVKIMWEFYCALIVGASRKKKERAVEPRKKEINLHAGAKRILPTVGLEPTTTRLRASRSTD